MKAKITASRLFSCLQYNGNTVSCQRVVKFNKTTICDYTVDNLRINYVSLHLILKLNLFFFVLNSCSSRPHLQVTKAVSTAFKG